MGKSPGSEKKRDFRNAMNEAAELQGRGDYLGARRAFTAAAELAPGDDDRAEATGAAAALVVDRGALWVGAGSLGLIGIMWAYALIWH